MKSIFIIIFIAVNIILHSEEVEIIDSHKNKIKIETKRINRVVSLAPNIGEIIYALNANMKLVGRTNYCDFPAEIKEIESVGEIMTPSFEKILSLNPNLVIASNHTTYKTYKKIKDHGIDILVLDDIETIDDIYEVINKLGKILDRKENAKALNDKLQKKISTIQAKKKNNIKVYYMLSYGRSGDYTAGGDTFVGNIISISGAINVAENLKGWKYSIEKILINDPDVILYSSEYIDIEKLKQENIYKDMRAIKNNNIYKIEEDILVRPGPRIWKGVKAIQEILYRYNEK